MAVVDGATVVMAPPVSDVSAGISDWWASSCSQPRPSRISSTTCSAWRTGVGEPDGSASTHAAGPSSAGMIPRTFGPA